MSETMLSANTEPTNQSVDSSPAVEAAAPEQVKLQQDSADAGSDPSNQPEGDNADAAKSGAPEAYEFKMPEGQELDAEVLKAYSEVAKQLDLPQESAQKVLDSVMPVMQARNLERIQAVHASWKQASTSDKEFGGEKLSENLALAQKALNSFGTPELRAFLEESQLGNHPEIIRAFYRAGRAISDDSYVGGRAAKSQPVARSFEDHLANLYNNK